MSKKHPKPRANKAHSQSHQGGAEHNQCKCDGSAKVSGEVGVRFEPALMTQYTPDQKETKSHNHRMEIIGWLTLIAVVIYAFLTFLLVKNGQDTYDAVDRPYVGVERTTPTFFLNGPSGSVVDPKTVLSNPATANFMRIDIAIKNFGSVPGLDVNPIIDARLNGKQIAPSNPLPYKGFELFPGHSYLVTVDLGPNIFPHVASGSPVFQMDITVHYRYGNKTYEYCERRQYMPQLAAFLDRGPICNYPWAVAF